MTRMIALVVIALFATGRFAAASDARNQPASAVTVARDGNSSEQIPTGFKVERYARVWEHNPFFLVTPAAPQAQHSPFEKLFLTSWLSDRGKDVIFVQDSDTNEVQRITSEPNQNKLRLIELRSNPNPRLVEAVISNGKEQGALKFQFDVQSPGGQSPVAQVQNIRVPGAAPNVAQVAHGALPQPPKNPLNPTGNSSSMPSSAPTSQPIARRISPGIPGGRMGGRPRAVDAPAG